MRVVGALLCAAMLAGCNVEADFSDNRWPVMSIVANGEPRGDEESTGSTWTFDAPRLVVHDGKGNEKICNFNADREYLSVPSPGGEMDG